MISNSNNQELNQLQQPLNMVYQFLRGDMQAFKFEEWIYSGKHIEEIIGKEVYHEVISLNFKDKFELDKIRSLLMTAVEGFLKNKCLCRAIKDSDAKVIGASEWLYSTTLRTVKRRTPWIRLDRCTDCGENWLIATDTVHEDKSYFQRLTKGDAEKIELKGQWLDHVVDKDIFWPTKNWLNQHGFSDLEEWQSSDNISDVILENEPWRATYNNQQDILQSEPSVCVKCKRKVKQSEILSWDDNVLGIFRTALCPYCNDATLVATDEDAKLTDEFIDKAHRSLFG